jgi:hypothetical protein
MKMSKGSAIGKSDAELFFEPVADHTAQQSVQRMQVENN